MKKVYFIGIITTALMLSACGSTSTPTVIPTIVLDSNNAPTKGNLSSGGITASAIVLPMREAELSFAAVGRVTEVNVQVGDIVSSGDVLIRLDTSILEAKVKEAEANLEAAQVQVRYLKRVGTDQVHLESAEAEVARAQALLDLANATLGGQATLPAPFDGTIVSVGVVPAETVVPGQVVIVLADLSKFQVETTDLSERNVTRVQIGQTANVFIEALNEEFAGKVTDIDRIGSTLGGDVVFKVTIELDTQPPGLLWGMSADVTIESGDE